VGRRAVARGRAAPPRRGGDSSRRLRVHHRDLAPGRGAGAHHRGSLEAGLALFIDYGFPSASSTTRSARGHAALPLPPPLPRRSVLHAGLQDITAHVDFTAHGARRGAGRAEVYGFTTQAYFLISCGLAVLVSAGDPTATLSELKATSAVHRLISPSEMGELFKVLGFGKGIDQPILGFQSARHLPL
jgi:SAM-dependent MidA family methyltransferase